MVMPEPELRALVRGDGFTIANLLYRLDDNGRYFEYRMTIRAKSRDEAGNSPARSSRRIPWWSSASRPRGIEGPRRLHGTRGGAGQTPQVPRPFVSSRLNRAARHAMIPP